MNNRWDEKKGEYEIGKVTIRTVDQAVSDYFTKKIKLTVDNGENARKNVPIVYAGTERWKAIRDNKGLRDENGTLILPVISVRRTDINRQKGFGGMAVEQPYISVTKKLTNKTTVLANLVDQRNKNGFPQNKNAGQAYEHLTLPFPDFCTFFYEISIWAQYQSQMNEIIEQIVYNYDNKDSFVMPVEYDKNNKAQKGYYFVGFADSEFRSDNNFQDMTDNERLVKYDYRIKVPVYLILAPDSETLSYGFDKGKKNSDGSPVVYKPQGASQIAIKEGFTKIIDEKPFELYDTTFKIPHKLTAGGGGGGQGGIPGPKGDKGDQGDPGATGPQGPMGMPGPIGPTGPQGNSGSIGPVGPSGSQGPSGAIGPVGPSGAQGPVGPSGAQGPIGMTGPSGSLGQQGPSGAIGPAGPSGAIGATGPSGAQGPSGTFDFSGADQRYAFTSSFNSYTSSLNTFTASVNFTTASLNSFTSSLTSIYDLRYVQTASYTSASILASITGTLDARYSGANFGIQSASNALMGPTSSNGSASFRPIYQTDIATNANFIIDDDFTVPGSYASGIVFPSGWLVYVVGGSTCASANPFPYRAGVRQIATAGTATSLIAISNTTAFVPGSASISCEWHVRLPTLSVSASTFTASFGLSNSSTAGVATNGVQFLYCHGINSGNWSTQNGQGAMNDSGIVVNANQWYKLFCILTPDCLTASYYIDNALVYNTPDNLWLPIPGYGQFFGPAASVRKGSGTGVASAMLDRCIIKYITSTGSRPAN